MTTKIAVIGAGLSGLLVANELKASASVKVFEKSRGTGGRMSTRYTEDYEFDHGVPFFKAQAPEFRNFLQRLIQDEVVTNWPDKDHFTAIPKMNALCKYLAKDIEVQTKTQVTKIQRNNKKWQLSAESDQSLGEYDWVICTAPPQQTANLFPTTFNGHEQVKVMPMLSTYALMLGFKTPLSLPWTYKRYENQDIELIVVNSAKPDRKSKFSLILYATSQWSKAHLETSLQNVQTHLLQKGTELTAYDLNQAQYSSTHLWRYSMVNTQSSHTPLVDSEKQLAICGDWCMGGGVEGAFNSAKAVSQMLKRALT